MSDMRYIDISQNGIILILNVYQYAMFRPHLRVFFYHTSTYRQLVHL